MRDIIIEISKGDAGGVGAGDVWERVATKHSLGDPALQVHEREVVGRIMDMLEDRRYFYRVKAPDDAHQDMLHFAVKGRQFFGDIEDWLRH